VPELPEVETVRRGLERQTLQIRIARVEVLRQRAIASPKNPEAFAAGLQGCRLQEWARRGKYLIGSLSRAQGDGGHWGVHLRMTGQFLLLQARDGAPARPCCDHTRVRIWSDQGDELRFVDTRSGQLKLRQLENLREALVEVLQNSIGAGGTTFSDFRDLSGTNGNYGGMAWVYRRGGEPCRRCGTPIRREKLGGRSSHWCPNCQH